MSGREQGIGAAAPALDLPTASGERRSLQDFRGKPAVVSFLGPAHCLFCRAHVIKVIQARNEFDRADANVVFVAFHDPELLTSKMLHDLDLPYVLLLDRTRETYARWGLGRYGLKAVLRPALYWQMMRMMLSGEKSLGTAPNPNQLGGDFVVDRAGRLVYANRMQSFYDRAPIPDLLAALRST